MNRMHYSRHLSLARVIDFRTYGILFFGSVEFRDVHVRAP